MTKDKDASTAAPSKVEKKVVIHKSNKNTSEIVVAATAQEPRARVTQRLNLQYGMSFYLILRSVFVYV